MLNQILKVMSQSIYFAWIKDVWYWPQFFYVHIILYTLLLQQKQNNAAFAYNFVFVCNIGLHPYLHILLYIYKVRVITSCKSRNLFRPLIWKRPVIYLMHCSFFCTEGQCLKFWLSLKVWFLQT